MAQFGYEHTGSVYTVAFHIFDVHMTVHRDKFFIIEPTRCTNFSKFYFWNEALHVSDSSSVHHQEFFHCTYNNGVCHRSLLTACEQEHLLLLTSCQQTCVTYTIAVCTVKNS